MIISSEIFFTVAHRNICLILGFLLNVLTSWNIARAEYCCDNSAIGRRTWGVVEKLTMAAGNSRKFVLNGSLTSIDCKSMHFVVPFVQDETSLLAICPCLTLS